MELPAILRPMARGLRRYVVPAMAGLDQMGCVRKVSRMLLTSTAGTGRMRYH